MSAQMPDTINHSRAAGRRAVLELTVNNHPGVMSHVCGLFARRAYNVEGILCMPLPEERLSRIWLLVNEESRLEQIIRQTMKLEDVIRVERHAADHEVFVRLEEFFGANPLPESAGADN